MSYRTEFQLRQLKNAIINNNLDLVHDMMMKGFSPNIIFHEPSRERGLHIAAKAGNDDMVKLLIDFGAKPYNIKTYPGKEDPLHIASSMGHVDVVRVLVEHGAWTNLRNAAGNTAIHVAAMGDHGDVICELLKKKRCQIDIKQKSGHTALHLAVNMQNRKATKALAMLGANLVLKDPKTKYTAVETTMLRNDSETFKIIFQYLPKIDYFDTLYKAICDFRVGDYFVLTMSQLGFNINGKDSWNRSLLKRLFDKVSFGYDIAPSWYVYRLLYLGVAPEPEDIRLLPNTQEYYFDDVINYIELQTAEGVKVLKYLLQYGYDVTKRRHGYRQLTGNKIYIHYDYCFEHLFHLCHYLGAYDAALVTVHAGVDISPCFRRRYRGFSDQQEAIFLIKLSERVRNPRSLQNICRNYITRRVRNYPTALWKIVKPLGLPAIVQDYLTFRHM